MRHYVIVVCSAALLAIVTVVVVPSLLKAQGQQPQVQGQGPGQRQGQGQGQGQAGGRGRGGRGQPAGPSKPTPRWPDGHPVMGSPLGERGIWGSCCGSLSNAQAPYQPWAKALFDYRRNNEFEPHTRCKPSGGARQFTTPYGTEFVDIPELKRMFIMDIGGPHTYRIIYMDGRPHPKDLIPSYYGHSIGKWEGDTLVVDTVGFNEKMWIDRAGTPHTEQLHYVERFTRTDALTMRYEATIEDPGAYTAPFNFNATMRFSGNSELFEYICQDNNFAPTLLIGSEEGIDRSSQIVP